MSIESIVNYHLNKYPKLKKIVKRCYQYLMYSVSHKVCYSGNIIRVSPGKDSKEYFFGYYDKSPWDASDRYMLCMKASDTWSNVSPKNPAQILLIDTAYNNHITILGETHSWNVQQGCMLQWLGPDYHDYVIYNDYRDGIYCSVVLNLKYSDDGTVNIKEDRIIHAPIYSVAPDGSFALTLDFSRLYRLRPGYGYYNLPETTAKEKLPNTPCIWYVDLKTGEVYPLLKYTDFASFEPRKDMVDAEHKVNHIMISPNGKRFMVLHRWFQKNRKYTRLVTCNIDGTDMYNLSDDDMVSHCCWKNDTEILAFANKRADGCGYYLMKDKTHIYERYWNGIDYDGHPSYSPDGSKIVFDRYPDRSRMASVMVSSAENREINRVHTLARVFAPFRYDNDTRCDLHPRWNHAGDMVCFDSVFENHRGLYTVAVCSSPNLAAESQNEEITKNNTDKHGEKIKFSIITPVYNSFHLMEDYFLSLNAQDYKNFELILIDDGSNDGSYEKLKQYIKNSGLDIKLYTTGTTSGPGYARNVGIDVATGDWITFVDSDDKVETTLLSEINAIIENNDVHCVIYDFYIKTKRKVSAASSMYCGKEGLCTVADCIKYVRNHSIGKFYKLQDIKDNNVHFPKLKRCEDVGFTCLAVAACKSVYYYPKPMYYYIQRVSSLSNDKNLDETDMVKAFGILEKTLGEKYPREIKERSVTDLLYGGVLMMCKAGKSSKEISDYINSYEKKYPEWWNYQNVKNLGKAKECFLMMVRYRQVVLIKHLALIHNLLIGRN